MYSPQGHFLRASVVKIIVFLVLEAVIAENKCACGALKPLPKGLAKKVHQVLDTPSRADFDAAP
jgi:hypothetical protein